MKSPCAVNLHNAVTVSPQRTGKRVAQLSSARMNEVCAALRFSLVTIQTKVTGNARYLRSVLFVLPIWYSSPNVYEHTVRFASRCP
jgi:hypothetical protein